MKQTICLPKRNRQIRNTKISLCWNLFILFSKERKKVQVLVALVFGLIQHFETPWTAARQDPLSTGFFRQEYWSGLPFYPPGDLSHPGIETMSLVSSALAGRFFYHRATWEAHLQLYLPPNFSQNSSRPPQPTSHWPWYSPSQMFSL